MCGAWTPVVSCQPPIPLVAPGGVYVDRGKDPREEQGRGFWLRKQLAWEQVQPAQALLWARIPDPDPRYGLSAACTVFSSPDL